MRRSYRQRRPLVGKMAELRAKIEARRRRREDHAISFTTERHFDAIAQGELRDLAHEQEVAREAMVEFLAFALAELS